MHAYSDFIRESELNARLGWLIMLGGFAYLTHRHRYLQGFFLTLLLLMTLSGAMDLLYAVTFGGVFTSASLEAISQTDSREVVEFITVYSSYENSVLLILYLSLVYFLLKRMLIHTSVLRKEKVLIGLAVVMLLVAIGQITKYQRVFDVLPGFNGVAIDYLNQREDFEKRVQERVQLDQDSAFTVQTDSAPQTYVIVIGEAMNRNHLGLYGYSRDTTPQLNALKSELVVFNDIITAFAQTKPSLERALTQANTVNHQPIEDAVSLIGLFNRAGFETWWLSNQQPMRMPFAGLAKAAHHQHFISHDFHGVQVKRYDETLLPYVSNALQNPAPKKVIFVHLMGSHLDYANRYPAQKAFFKGTQGIQAYTDTPSESQQNYINAYDNSIRYTDGLMAQLIEQLKQQTSASALLLFSDHGEEVFDTKDFKGHGPDGVTPSMVEVPFIVWRNSAYRQAYAQTDRWLLQQRNQPGLLEDVFHFAHCLTQVDSSLYDARQALCSAEYQPRKRLVYKQDYDTQLKGNSP